MRSARSRDLVDVVRRLQEEVRQLRLKKRCHTESKNYIIGGAVDTGLSIPRFFVGVNADSNSPEHKLLLGFWGTVESGSIVVDWYLNGSPVLTGHAIDTTGPNEALLTSPILMVNRDFLKPVITSGTGADLTAAAVFSTSGR